MKIRVPPFFPYTYQVALQALHKQNNIPLVVLESTALYMWGSTFTFVASRDGYLRILSTSCFFEVPMGPAALWCLCFSFGRLYISFWGGKVKAFNLDDVLCGKAMCHCTTPDGDTILCLSAAVDVLCGGSAAGYCYIFSCDLALIHRLQLVVDHWSLTPIYSCICLNDATFLVGSEVGRMHQVVYTAGSPCVMSSSLVHDYEKCGIYCLHYCDCCRDFIFVGLEFGVDVFCASKLVSLYRFSTKSSVWSIAAFGDLDLLVGMWEDGVDFVRLEASAIREGLPAQYPPFERKHHVLRSFEFIGTCSAITDMICNRCYAASNHSRMYYINIDEHSIFYLDQMALPVMDPGDLSGVHRRDIYDIVTVPNLVHARFLVA